MFEYLAKRCDRIVVTGPHRTGTTIASQMIAHDTGYRYVDEMDDLAGFYPSRLQEWLERKLQVPDVVIQGPSLLKMLVDSPPPNTLIVLMRRAPQDVLSSEIRTGWEFRQRELELYGHTEGDPTVVKYAYWEANPPPISTEIEYESLRGHWAWVEPPRRRGWHRKQTAVGAMAIRGVGEPRWMAQQPPWTPRHVATPADPPTGRHPFPW